MKLCTTRPSSVRFNLGRLLDDARARQALQELGK
jgi:hypothetical protein